MSKQLYQKDILKLTYLIACNTSQFNKKKQQINLSYALSISNLIFEISSFYRSHFGRCAFIEFPEYLKHSDWGNQIAFDSSRIIPKFRCHSLLWQNCDRKRWILSEKKRIPVEIHLQNYQCKKRLVITNSEITFVSKFICFAKIFAFIKFQLNSFLQMFDIECQNFKKCSCKMYLLD